MTNRVDELESQVATLQATVDGLTEELVETKERLRLLEESVDVDLTSGTRKVGHESDADDGTDEAPADPAGPDAAAGADHLTESRAQAASRSRAETAADDANFIDADGGGSVPDDGAAGGDGTKTDGAEDDDEAATDDDIIVA
jgi:uncharacterized coiled-coil protein SlyX